MKTKEFIKRVEELGYRVVDKETFFVIEDTDGSWLAAVDKDHLLDIHTHLSARRILSDREKVDLYKVIYDYTSTPPDEREDVKKYYLNHRWIQADRLNWYLSHLAGESRSTYSLKDFSFASNKDKEFTQKEIEEIKERFDTDLGDYEMVEVDL